MTDHLENGSCDDAKSAAVPKDREAAAPGKASGPSSPLVYLVPGLLVVSLIGWGGWSHWQVNAVAATTQQQTIDYRPTLQVTQAKGVDGPVTLRLPGTTAPFDQANIYTRATGYIAERRVDIGSNVKAGDLLVRIAAADLDGQLAQAIGQLAQTHAALAVAQANVLQMQANIKLGTVTNARTGILAVDGWATKQDADTARYNLQSQLASLASNQASVASAEGNIKAELGNVDYLKAQVSYELVTAPFDGIVTVRNIDNGDLVTANSGTGTPAFTVERQDVLRIFVNVPQSNAIGLRDGVAAEIHVPELPSRTFHGAVTRTSVSLNSGSRTVRTEVDVANLDGTLRPGLYVDVDLAIPRAAPGVIVPAEAIIFNGKGLRVAVVKDGVAHLIDVTIATDFGTTIELRSGIQGGDQIALSPPAGLEDGQQVAVRAAAHAPP